MQWLTETIITLTPLSLGIILLAGMALGWIIYALRGYKYWYRRFHHYTLPRKRNMQKNHGYVEYVPNVVNVSSHPIARKPQVIEKQRTNISTQINQKHSSTKDDLQVIEGIGPRIQEILNSQGIYTWRELAMTPISNLVNILARNGKGFKMHDPSSWPEQAKMADQGQWEALKKWQDNLHGGVAEKKS